MKSWTFAEDSLSTHEIEQQFAIEQSSELGPQPNESIEENSVDEEALLPEITSDEIQNGQEFAKDNPQTSIPPPETEMPASPIVNLAEEPESKTADSPQEEAKYCRGYLGLRHRVGGGVGYPTGYTSLTGLTFFTLGKKYWPFLDVRLHELNNNTQAGNIGLGCRYLSSKKRHAFGANTYYDYRNNHHWRTNFHQIAAGFEFLSRSVDLRLNGYLPVGGKKQTLQRCFFTYPGGFFISKKKQEVALRGANLEIGGILKKLKNITFYGAAGPYYFGGNVCRKVIGGKLRLNAIFLKRIYLEGSLSSDSVFGTRIQGLAGIQFPLGCKTYGNRVRLQNEKLTQSVERFEIIVLDKNCKWKFNY